MRGMVVSSEEFVGGTMPVPTRSCLETVWSCAGALVEIRGRRLRAPETRRPSRCPPCAVQLGFARASWRGIGEACAKRRSPRTGASHMSRMRRGLRRLNSPLAFVAAVLLLAGCASTTPIRQLLDDPGRYDGKSVQI